MASDDEETKDYDLIKMRKRLADLRKAHNAAGDKLSAITRVMDDADGALDESVKLQKRADEWNERACNGYEEVESFLDASESPSKLRVVK